MKGQETNLISFLSRILDKSLIQNELIKLLKIKISDPFTLSTVLSYIEENQLYEAKEYLIPYFSSSGFDSFIRNKALMLYLTFKGKLNEEVIIFQYLDCIKSNMEIDWKAIDILCIQYPETICTWLKNKMMELEIDINHVTIRLLPYEPEEALSMYLEEFKKRQTALSDRFHENGNFLAQIKVKEINPSLLYDFLCELLIISVGKKFKTNDRSNFIPSIFNRFFDLFKEGLIDDSILKIEELLTSVKKDGQNEENKKNIIYWHKDFTKKCHIELDKKVSFRRAKRDLKLLLPELYAN